MFLVHENNRFEKSVILGRNKFTPNVKLIGNFHTSKPRRLLNLYPASKQEQEYRPTPDVVLFNNINFQKYFEKHYPEINPKPGFCFKDMPQFDLPANKCVLICLPGEINGAKRLAELAIKLHRQNDVSIFVRCHPMLAEAKSLFADVNIKISENSISEDLVAATHVVSCYSAVLLEGLSANRMVGIVTIPGSLNLNPFDDLPCDGLFSVISNFDEFSKFVSQPNSNARADVNLGFYSKPKHIENYIGELL